MKGNSFGVTEDLQKMLRNTALSLTIQNVDCRCVTGQKLPERGLWQW